MTDVLHLAPSAVAEWIPFAKAAGFFLATFVLEDVAAVGAGLLLASGGIFGRRRSLRFLGIWMGDADLCARALCRTRMVRAILAPPLHRKGRGGTLVCDRGTPF
jgi:MprA protease rhombosortase-interaction domain-containing protein